MDEVDRQILKGAIGISDEDLERLSPGLKRILSARRNTLAEAGARARELAVREFDWQRVADRSVEAYRKYAA